MNVFQRRDIEQYTDSLAAYMPNGDLFASKNIKDSNFRKLLRGLAGELFNANGALIQYSDEIIPDRTNKFLLEWESVLGIPDDCFSGEGTNDERRRDILVKLASLGIQTQVDYVELAAVFGVTATVRAGGDAGVFPLSFPIFFFETAEDARFTIIIDLTLPEVNTFPYSMPLPFGSNDIGIISCIFEKLKPAHCDLIIRGIA